MRTSTLNSIAFFLFFLTLHVKYLQHHAVFAHYTRDTPADAPVHSQRDVGPGAARKRAGLVNRQRRRCNLTNDGEQSKRTRKRELRNRLACPLCTCFVSMSARPSRDVAD